MSDQQLPSSPRVTLEDLLRIKRAERPPAEFWMEFERSLRSKQLAAIVDKRPWWRLRSRSSSLNRWSIPLGAAAASLTLVFTAIRAPHSAPPLTAGVPSNSSPAITTIAQVSAASPAVETSEALEPAISPSSSIAQTVTALPVEPLAIAPTSVAVASTSSPALPDHLVSVTEQIAGIGLAGDVDLEKSAAPKFASVGLKDSSDEMNAFFESSARLSSGMRPERVASVEPLSQVTSPRDARRARLLAFTSSVDTHSPQYSDSSNVIRSRDRIASHLSEEALYDTIRRLGLKNGGVSIQF
jgi:hypothetical protein